MYVKKKKLFSNTIEKDQNTSIIVFYYVNNYELIYFKMTPFHP